MANVFKQVVNLVIVHAGSTRVNYNVYTAPSATKLLIKQFSVLTTAIAMIPATSYFQLIPMINGKDVSLARIPGNAGNVHNVSFAHRTGITMQNISSVSAYGYSESLPASLDNAIVEATQLLQFGIAGLTGALTGVTLTVNVSGIEIS